MGTRVLILKFAAIGDVLRTTPILRGLKRRYPQSHITWVTDKSAYPLLANNPYIDGPLILDIDTLIRLQSETFDLLISLDKEPGKAGLAMLVNANKKIGIGLNPKGNPYPLNEEAEYYFKLGLSDKLKFYQNRKAYPELTYETLGFDYQQDEYVLELTSEEIGYGRKVLDDLGITPDDYVIGLNTGAGGVFANKAWGISGYVRLIEKLNAAHPSIKIALLGGPDERDRNETIKSMVSSRLYNTGCNNPLMGFCGIINGCNLIITGDTMAMHIAIALKKSVLAIFAPTCEQEIELYGRGEKIVSELACAPCYKRHCGVIPTCMDTITVERVYSAVEKLITTSRRQK
jgi:heptosyltransferase-2